MRLVAWFLLAMASIAGLGGWAVVALRAQKGESIAPWKRALDEGTVILLEARSTDKVAKTILPTSTLSPKSPAGDFRVPPPPANLPDLPPPTVEERSTRR
ncbi:hypothetical protein K2X85_16925 [bacterium]|nr:hypothetical protein [bacterium]